MCATGPIGLTNFPDEDLVVMYRTGTHQEREDAAGELAVRIRRIARSVVHNRPVGRQFKYDFEEDMPAEVLAKVDLGAFDPGKGRFFAWCWTVLDHRFQDLAEQWVRRNRGQRPLPPGDLPGDASLPPAGACGDDDPGAAVPSDEENGGNCPDERFSPRELSLL